MASFFPFLAQAGISVNEVSGYLPLPFFVACAVAAFLGFEAMVKWREPWAKPALAVYGTVSVWYLFEIIYLKPEWHFSRFEPHIIDMAFFQVVLFFLAFRFFCFLTQWIWLPALRFDPDEAEITFRGFSVENGRAILRGLALLWVVLAGIAILRHGGDVIGTLFPFTSGRNMWGRAAAAGAGPYGFLISTGSNLYVFCCAFMGVLFVLQKDRLTRFWTTVLICLGWPALLFTWTRNIALAITVPAVICYFLFSEHGMPRKVITLGVLFFVFNFWMLVMLDTRERGFQNFFQDFSFERYFGGDEAKDEPAHAGLNMFGELCYMNTFLEEGTYEIDFGRRYYAEAVNFVPRALWPNKPLIGIDYAEARGFGGADTDIGVHATIATGLIGQGIGNFGLFFGPIAAAFLMAVWTALLTRLWLQRRNMLRLGLFLFGMALTFNLGRDITLLVLWPVIFGYAATRAYEIWKARQGIDLNAPQVGHPSALRA